MKFKVPTFFPFFSMSDLSAFLTSSRLLRSPSDCPVAKIEALMWPVREREWDELRIGCFEHFQMKLQFGDESHAALDKGQRTGLTDSHFLKYFSGKKWVSQSRVFGTFLRHGLKFIH